MSVLLVDDNDSSLVVPAVLLEDEGFEVDVAASFAAASRKLAVWGARYDRVILDQNLGDGRGTDLMPAVRARMPEAKALLMSGDVEKVGGAARVFDAVLSKGTEFPVLAATLRRLLTGGQGATR